MTLVLQVLGGVLFLVLGAVAFGRGGVLGAVFGVLMVTCGAIPFAVLWIRWRRSRDASREGS